ncbi:MAG TPA: hypothetical protein VF043_16590 [Ktedonobacteraceae bacterium]
MPLSPFPVKDPLYQPGNGHAQALDLLLCVRHPANARQQHIERIADAPEGVIPVERAPHALVPVGDEHQHLEQMLAALREALVELGFTHKQLRLAPLQPGDLFGAISPYQRAQRTAGPDIADHRHDDLQPQRLQDRIIG